VQAPPVQLSVPLQKMPSLVQALPVVVREQPSTTLVVVVAHVPPLHVKSVRGRVREPDSAHSLTKLQDVGVPKVGVPQGTPLVDGRMHDCVSVVVDGMQVPPMQR
jgi:hypothetical protein